MKLFGTMSFAVICCAAAAFADESAAFKSLGMQDQAQPVAKPAAMAVQAADLFVLDSRRLAKFSTKSEAKLAMDGIMKLLKNQDVLVLNSSFSETRPYHFKIGFHGKKLEIGSVSYPVMFDAMCDAEGFLEKVLASAGSNAFGYAMEGMSPVRNAELGKYDHFVRFFHVGPWKGPAVGSPAVRAIAESVAPARFWHIFESGK